MTKLLENTKISSKIIALLVILGLVTMFIAWNGSTQLLKSDDSYSSLVNTKLPNSTMIARVNKRAIEMVYAGYRSVSYDGSTEDARATPGQEDKAFNEALQMIADVKKSEPEIADHLDSIARNFTELHALTSKAIRFGLQNSTAEANAILGKADVLATKINADITAFNNGRIADGRKLSDDLSAKTAATSTMMYVIAFGSILAAIALGLFVTKIGITTPLTRLRDQMIEIAGSDYSKAVEGTARGDEVGAMAKAVMVFRENGIAKQAADAAILQSDAEQKVVVQALGSHLSELSDGDLTTQITADFPGDYATLKINFNEALAKLRELIGAVSESAATIRTGSGEIAQASEDLARRTESNAASLEETAASVTQMDGRLKASAVAATRTVERADQAIATVGGGRAVADEAVQAMGRVSDSAKGIDSVIEGLDKIAFQTRVLAMNAAVEAGRAGDAGRGFAVVADLVSALAMRAEEEAKRARDQLTVTQTDIVTAVEAVQKVDGALADISGDVGHVHELLATMASDNQAQSAAITQISAAIGTMDQATQQNAAMVEETSAAARNLASEVGGLTEQAGRFNVGATRSAVRSPVAAKGKQVDARNYASPVKALPAAGVAALVRSDEEWNAF